ncbi:MAG: hypothetical protein ACFFG0_03325 [Candidatus Thorarchaeota archaeon]
MSFNELMKKKLEFYKSKDKPIYFKLIESDNFRNGFIIEIGDDYMIIDEIEMGEIIVYYEEIQRDSIAESKHWKFKDGEKISN